MRWPVRSIHQSFQQLVPERRGAILLVVLAVLLKLVFLVALDAKPPNVDGIRYLSAAQEMAAGNLSASLAAYPMPAYPFLIWITHVVVHDWLLSARLLSALALLGATWVLYRITHTLFGRKAAFWACLAFLLSPMQNELTVLVYRGPIYLLFFAGAVWLMMRAVDSPRPWRIVIAAWMGFVAALFRIEGLFLTPLFLFAMVLLAFLQRDARRPILLGLGAWALTVLLLLGVFFFAGGVESVGLARFDEAWTRLSALIHGGALDNYRRIKDGLEAIEASSVVPSQEGNFGEISLGLFWLIYLVGLCQLIVKVLHPVFVVPFVTGVRGECRRPACWIVAVFVVYLLVLYAALVMNDYSGKRFVFATSFLLYPWIGRGFARMTTWIEQYRGTQVRWRLAFYVVFLVVPLWATTGKIEGEDESAVAAGHWFAQSIYRNEPIVGNDPRIPFAAGIRLYGGTSQYLHYRPEDRDYSKIEALALASERHLIFLKLRKTKLERMPVFTQFREIKRFSDAKKIVFVFADVDRLPAQKNEP